MKTSEQLPNWLTLSAILNVILAGFVIFVISYPPPMINYLGLECNNSKTCYDRYKANCEAAEKLRTIAVQNLEIASTIVDRTNAQANKIDAENQIVRECDLAAQYLAAESAASMDFSTYIMTVLTFFGVILISVTLFYTKRTLNEAREATVAADKTADVAREIGQKQVRAYISVDLSRGGVTPGMVEREKMSVWANVLVKNVGASPAKKISSSIFFRFGDQNLNMRRGKMVTISRGLAPGSISQAQQSDQFTMQDEFGFFSSLDEPIRARVITRYTDVFGEKMVDEAFFVFSGGGRLADWVFENRNIVDVQQWSKRPEGAEWQNQSTYDEHRQDGA